MHSCAIQNGAVKCWGDNTHGQIGSGDNNMQPQYLAPEEVSGLNRGVTAISATLYSHTCAIKDGAGQCWGQNEASRLGRTTGDTSISGEVSGLNDGVTAISAGNRHGCAVHNEAAKCWGFNGSGQLGDGSTVSTPTPVSVDGLDGQDNDITAITAGGHHSCAVVDATARCWGRGSEGQLGDGTNMQRLLSVEVEGLNSGVTAIAAGWFHTCAIVNAAARCWGFNGNGQLGNNSQVQSSVAVSVQGLDDGVTAIAAGGSPAG